MLLVVLVVMTTMTTMMILVSIPAKFRLNCGKNLVVGIGSPEEKILNIPLIAE
jgi:hypothetical protein